jgi:mono/diheme cytochrome c family protein
MQSAFRAVTALGVLLGGAIAAASHWPATAVEESPIDVPSKLTETGLYAPGRINVIDGRNRSFSPQYPLWSDGASKTRWVYLPPGSAIDDSDPERWDFPAGTRFWKEFTFNGRKVETRLLWRATRARWVFASYVWNDAQNEATLVSTAGERDIIRIGSSRAHSIPSTDDCAACHGGARPRPLGFNTLQLSPDRDPNAIHAEAFEDGMVSLKTLIEEGRIPQRSSAAPPRIATDNPRTRAALGYLLANCGSCHDGEGEISAVGPVLRQRDLLVAADAVAKGLVDQRTKWQAPGAIDGETALIDAAAPDRSAILLRMRSRGPSTQMPPLGTVLRDHAAVDVLTQWIREEVLQPSHVR